MTSQLSLKRETVLVQWHRNLNRAFMLKNSSRGPKNYAYRTVNPTMGESETVCNVRGITLNYRAFKLVNFDVIRDIILRGAETDRLIVHTEDKIMRKRAGGRIDIITEPEDKMYRVSFFKKRRLADNTSVPFGYINERRTVVTSVMSHDLRFRHPFSWIKAGPIASGKSSFSIKLLQNLESQCTEREFAGGIMMCYSEKNNKPSL
jgi:hypothetical protein